MPVRPDLTAGPSWKLRVGALAGGAAAGVAALLALAPVGGGSPADPAMALAGTSDDISGPCDEPEHADDPRCTTTSVPRSTTTTIAGPTSTTITTAPDDDPAPGTPPSGEVRTIDAAGAGTVVVAVEGTSLRLISATPASGWQVEVEQASGVEVEVDFRAGTRRVQVNLELEDGQVRERVRVRDDATGTDVRSEDGVVVDDDADDSSDHEDGDEDRDEDTDDDSSGHSGHSGSGRDHPEDD